MFIQPSLPDTLRVLRQYRHMKRTSPAACSALLILPERAERDPAILQFTRHFTHVADFGTRAHVYADVQGQLVPSLQALRVWYDPPSHADEASAQAAPVTCLSHIPTLSRRALRDTGASHLYLRSMNTPEMLVPVTCNATCSQALLDTGASDVFYDSSLLTKHDKVQPCAAQFVTGAGGQQLRIHGTITKLLKLGNYEGYVPGYVVSNLLEGTVPIILGLSWMKQHKVHLDMGRMLCRIHCADTCHSVRITPPVSQPEPLFPEAVLHMHTTQGSLGYELSTVEQIHKALRKNEP